MKGGVGAYVDLPLGWTELAQLAQCKGEIQEGKILFSAIYMYWHKYQLAMFLCFYKTVLRQTAATN